MKLQESLIESPEGGIYTVPGLAVQEVQALTVALLEHPHLRRALKAIKGTRTLMDTPCVLSGDGDKQEFLDVMASRLEKEGFRIVRVELATLQFDDREQFYQALSDEILRQVELDEGYSHETRLPPGAQFDNAIDLVNEKTDHLIVLIIEGTEVIFENRFLEMFACLKGIYGEMNTNIRLVLSGKLPKGEMCGEGVDGPFKVGEEFVFGDETGPEEQYGRMRAEREGYTWCGIQ